jgi:hypothetical protein
LSYIFSTGEIQDLVKGTPTVVLTNGVSFFVSDMVIRCNEDADRVRLCGCELGTPNLGRADGLIPVNSGILEVPLEALGRLPRPIERKDVVDVLYADTLVGRREEVS